MSPKTTDNPKDSRLEIKLSAIDREMLDFCADIFSTSKAEIIRMGIQKIHSQAQRQKEYQEDYDDAMEGLDAMVKEAEEERENQIYEDAYEIAFDKAYKEEYAKLIRDSGYPSEAKDVAEEYAKDIATCEAGEAVKDFWES